MIPANELRIGNLVFPAPRGGKVIIVTADLIKEIADGKTTVRPIGLTRPIVEDLGFRQMNIHSGIVDGVLLGALIRPAIKIGDNAVLSWGQEGITLTLWDLNMLRKFPDMKIHQLQNLYFALMGEELDYSKIKNAP